MKKTAIFFKPYNQTLESIKASLEPLEDYSIYEVGNPQEYGQILGILEGSYTFSSDLDVTKKYVKLNKKILVLGKHKNVFVSNELIPPRIQNALVDHGIDEILKENLPVKLYFKNMEVFFKKFDKKERKVTEFDSTINKSEVISNKNNKINEKANSTNQSQSINDQNSNNLNSPLKGKLNDNNKEEDGFLKGKTSTDNLDSKNSSESKFNENNKIQEKNINPQSTEIDNSDSTLDQKKNNSKNNKTENYSAYSGKASTDELGSAPLKGEVNDLDQSNTSLEDVEMNEQIDISDIKSTMIESNISNDKDSQKTDDEIGRDGIGIIKKDENLSQFQDIEHANGSENNSIEIQKEDSIDFAKKNKLKDFIIDNPDTLSIEKEFFDTEDNILNDSKESNQTELNSLEELKEIYKEDHEVEIALIEKEDLEKLTTKDKDTVLSYKVDDNHPNKSDKIPDDSIGINIEDFIDDLEDNKIDIEDQTLSIVEQSHNNTLCSREENAVLSFDSVYLEYLILYQDIFYKNKEDSRLLFHFINFFIKQEFKYCLLIAKIQSDSTLKLVYNGYLSDEGRNNNIESWLEQNNDNIKITAESSIREISLEENNSEYYFPFFNEEKTEVIACALVHSKAKIIDTHKKAIDLFLQVSSGALGKLLEL